MIFQTFAVK